MPRRQFCTGCRRSFTPKRSESKCPACKRKPRTAVDPVTGRKTYDITGAAPLSHFPGYIKPKGRNPYIIKGTPFVITENDAQNLEDAARRGELKDGVVLINTTTRRVKVIRPGKKPNPRSPKRIAVAGVPRSHKPGCICVACSPATRARGLRALRRRRK